MRAPVTAFICLAIGTACLGATAPAPRQPAPRAAPAPVDRTVMHVQVILDRLGFSPGVIDGRRGQSLTAALEGFQESRGLEETGEIDTATLRALHRYRALRPTIVATIGAADAAGPFVRIPEDEAEQAKLERMGYRSLMERLAERFHTTPETLVRLNSPTTRIGAGQRIVVPGVLPSSRNYPGDNTEWSATLSSLNVEPDTREAALVVVDESDGVLRVFDDQDRLIAQFPATMGSASDPLPLGDWTIRGNAPNPTWTRDPSLLRGVSESEGVLEIPPGPNNPVGVMWIDLSKEHYGIHGTNEPSQIGRAESNGCIRLTNWDVARLSLMVRPGTPARFVA